MSKPFATDEFALGTAALRWLQTSTDPQLAGGQAGPVGSLWDQSGAFPATGLELYQKLNTNPVTGWVHQNLVNLLVFNVKTYGAVGDGATDDTAAINAAVTAAAAAGGGTIYFPPTLNSYRVTKPVSGLGSIILDNKHDLTFLGDGPASTIAMIGSAAAGDWYMFRIRDGSKRISFINLHLDGTGITNPDPAHQNHLIEMNGVAGDPLGGPSNIDIVGCWFSAIVGDGIRNLGESGEAVTDVRVLYNAADMPNCRSFVEAQRYSHNVLIHYNWITGSGDQDIDFEPTGGTPGTGSGPDSWSIIGNLIDHSSNSTDSISLSGAADPTSRCILAYNIIVNGGAIGGERILNITVQANILTSNSAVVANSLCFYNRGSNQIITDGNIFIRQIASANACISTVADVNNPGQFVITDNICANIANAAGTAVIAVESSTEVLIAGNVTTMVPSVVNTSVALSLRSTSQIGDHNQVIGNLAVADTTNMLNGVQINASPLNERNCLINMNMIKNAFSISRFNASGGGVYQDWQGAQHNNGINCTNDGIEANGSSIEGAIGPGCMTTIMRAAGGPEGVSTAPKGSFCMNEAGSQGSTLFIKESGTGVSGSANGWVRDGAIEIVFGMVIGSVATAVRYLAPGSALLVEGTVEIKFACPRAGILRNLRFKATAAGTGGGNNTYRLNINGGNTAVLITLANTASSGTGVSSVLVAKGDLLSIQVTKTIAPTTPQVGVEITFELTS